MNNQKKWTAFKSGEEEAFSELFFDYYSMLYRYGLKLVKEEELVKDVIQDFYLYLFENRENLTDDVSNITSYLLSSFRRRLLREIDRRRKEERKREDIVSDAETFAFTIEEIIIKKESKEQNKEMLLRLLDSLPPRQKEILYLKYYLNLSLQEIADKLSISYQVVANHLYRAVKKMQKK